MNLNNKTYNEPLMSWAKRTGSLNRAGIPITTGKSQAMKCSIQFLNRLYWESGCLCPSLCNKNLVIWDRISKMPKYFLLFSTYVVCCRHKEIPLYPSIWWSLMYCDRFSRIWTMFCSPTGHRSSTAKHVTVPCALLYWPSPQTVTPVQRTTRQKNWLSK